MNKRPFPLMFLTVVIMLLLSVTGCEKNDYDDSTGEETTDVTDVTEQDPGSDDDDGYGDDDWDDDWDDEPTYRGDTLTVAEFIEGNFQGGAFVEGYIVGDCTKSFKYAEFEPPFNNPQALLLADRTDEYDKSYILAVQLKSGSKARAHMNLVDNPAWYHKKVVLFGYREKYLGMAGLKDLGAYPTYMPD